MNDDHRHVLLGESLYRLFQTYRRALRESHQQCGQDLTVGQVRALKRAHFLPDATVQRIAEFMEADRAQITRIVASLRQNGLVVSRNNPRDGRSPIIESTEAGRALVDSFMEIQSELETSMSAGLSDTEVNRFVALSETMIENLNAASADNGS